MRLWTWIRRALGWLGAAWSDAAYAIGPLGEVYFVGDGELWARRWEREDERC